ncbi:MAG: replicative DNA helicase [Alphaproteobacteria bacterium]|nr:replicative DNA helicase [Alphaproteobacteria bacterium]
MSTSKDNTAIKSNESGESNVKNITDGADVIALRALPQNLEAEQALLSAILTNNRSYERVSDFLRAEHFSDPAHAKIFESCAKLIELGHLADPITLKSYLEQVGELEEIGGQQYLIGLVNASVAIINAAEYGKLIHDRYLRRELIDLGQGVISEAFEEDLDTTALDQIEITERKLYGLASEGLTEGGFTDFATALTEAVDIAAEAYKSDGHISGYTTGLTDLDKKTGGLHSSDLIVLAGRPGMGKTALVTNIAYNTAHYFMNNPDENGKPKTVAFFSLEMSADQLATRILSSETEISSHKIRTGEVEEEEFPRIAACARALEKTPLYIDDTPGLTVNNLRTRARRLARSKGLGLIILDYIQLLSSAGGRKNDSRANEVSEITRGLKILAKELNVPVIALSQLNRGVEQRDDKRPMLSDLRESGSIEQDADMVWFVYREYYYLDKETAIQKPSEKDDEFHKRCASLDERKEDMRYKSEVVIAKQRHGPTGIIPMSFIGEFTRFGDLIEDDHLPEETW